MPQFVDVKGVGKVEFPDGLPRETMLQALRRKFAQMPANESGATVAPYNPSLSERTASGISNVLQRTGLVSDRYGANRIGDNIGFGLSALPVIGDAIGGDDLGRAIAQGDGAGIGFAALGAIPVVGDAARALRASDAVKRFSDMGVKSAVRENTDLITLDKIIVPKEQRGGGVGTDFMNELINYSDQKGLPIALTPSSDFGGSKSRLAEFYKRFGFVENKGRNKRYEISEAMYRDPQQNPLAQIGDAIAKEVQPVKLYRGVSSANRKIDPNVTWFSTDPKLAKGYSDRNEVFERSATISNPFNAGDDKNTLTPRQFASRAISQLDKSKIDKKQVLMIRDEFLDLYPNPDSNARVIDFWASDDGKEKVADFLEQLGFDAIRLKEEGVETFGLIKAKD